MIPILQIKGTSVDVFFLYISILGILLVIGTWLRLRVPLLKKYYVPASLIAGIVGLMLGPHFIGLFTKEMTGFWSALSGRLIVIVFAPMLIIQTGKLKEGLIKKAFAQIMWSYNACCLQYAWPLLLTAFFLAPALDINPLFGVITEEGWAGGHGTAGGMGIIFEELQWADGQSLAITSATIGLAFGIFAGIALINIGVRRGWAKYLTAAVDLSNTADEMWVGEQKTISAYNSVSAAVINNFAFHFALIGIAMFLGWILNKVLKSYLSFSVSWFVTALFAGGLLGLLLKKTKWAQAMDQKTFGQIQGWALEFLVVGAVASVNVPIVIAYAMPLIIQQVGMGLIMLFLATWFSKRILGDNWFETMLLLFGTFTGVMATGLLLYKTADPETKSDVLEVYAARAPFTSWAIGGGILTSLTPGWVVRYGALKVGGIYVAVAILTFILPLLFCRDRKVQSEI